MRMPTCFAESLAFSHDSRFVVRLLSAEMFYRRIRFPELFAYRIEAYSSNFQCELPHLIVHQSVGFSCQTAYVLLCPLPL